MENETIVAPKTERELLLDEIILCREAMISAKNWINNAKAEVVFLSSLPKVDKDTDKKVNEVIADYQNNLRENVKTLVDLFPKMKEMQARIKEMPEKITPPLAVVN